MIKFELQMIFVDSYPCPRLLQLLGERLTSPEYQAIDEANKDLYEYIAERMGMGRPITNV